MKKILILLLCLFLPITAFAEPFRVYDSADLFTTEQEAALEEAIQAYRWETKTDLCILTTDDFLGYNNQLTIADSFYGELGLGITDRHNGIIFHVDMCNRVPAIYTHGSMVSLMDDDNLQHVFDVASPFLSAGQYAEGMHAVIDALYTIHDEYWTQYIE